MSSSPREKTFAMQKSPSFGGCITMKWLRNQPHLRTARSVDKPPHQLSSSQSSQKNTIYKLMCFHMQVSTALAADNMHPSTQKTIGPFQSCCSVLRLVAPLTPVHSIAPSSVFIIYKPLLHSFFSCVAAQ